mgnify:FL=1
MTDEELAISYMEGDNKAFELLLAHNQSKVFSYILFVVHDEDRANDIFQDTFIKIIAKLQKGLYTPTGKFSAWCMRIAHNVIMDHYRGIRNGHIVEPTEDNDLSNLSGENMEVTNIENDYVNQQVLDDVKKMMRLLPAPQREVVYMRFYQQLSFKEIADVTNVSINTALGRMRYALLNMRKMARDHNLQLQLV